MDFTLESGLQPRFDPAETTDRRRSPNEDIQSLLSARLGELPAEEQALIRSLYLDGTPATEVATLLDMDPRAVRRRGRRIADRILSDRFTFILRSRDVWPLRRRRFAREVFLRGRSTREAAARMGLSVYAARREYRAIMTLFESWAARQRPTRPGAAAQPEADGMRN